MNIPSREECMQILAKNKTPSNVIDHSKAVCKIAEEITDNLIKKGFNVNKDLVIVSALPHDTERVKDNHVEEGAKLLKAMGFPEIANIVKKHSLNGIDKEENQPQTYEEKIILYADKRVIKDKIVTLKERFDDLEKRYNINLSKEFEFMKKIEAELQ